SEFAPGCTLRRIRIKPSSIEVTVIASSENSATLTLYPPRIAARATDLASFSVELDPGTSGLESCLASLRSIAAGHDDGNFWEEHAVWAEPDRNGDPRSAVPVGDAPIGEVDRSRPPRGLHWQALENLLGLSSHGRFGDAALPLLFLSAAWLGLLAANLRREGLRLLAILTLVSLVAAGLRAGLSAEVPMAPWPYSR